MFPGKLQVGREIEVMSKYEFMCR